MNVSQESAPAASTTSVAQSPRTAARVPPPPARPAVEFPAKANYVGKISTRKGVITLDGHLDGNAITGTLGIGKQAWDFTAAPVVGADDVNRKPDQHGWRGCRDRGGDRRLRGRWARRLRQSA